MLFAPPTLSKNLIVFNRARFLKKLIICSLSKMCYLAGIRIKARGLGNAATELII